MIRAAIVGLGPHGMRMFKAAERVTEVDLVAVVDRDEAKLQQEEVVASKALGLTGLSELWSHNIQLLMIATNGPSHAAISLEGIENGITHLLVTKPFTCSLEDAVKVNEAAKKNNVKLSVDHLLRYDSTYAWVAQQAQNDAWGELKRMYIQRPGIGLGCLGVHSFDIANFMVGSTPKTITGWVDEPVRKNPRGEQFVDPGGTVVMQYDNGVRVVVDQIEEGSGPQSIEMHFKYARVKLDEKLGTLEVVSKDRNFVPGPNKKPVLDKQINPHQATEVKIDTVKLLENMLLELVEGNTILADGDAGQKAVEILVAAYISNSNNNTPVELPLKEEGHIKLNLPVT